MVHCVYKFTFTLLYLYEHVQEMKHVRILVENIDKSSDEARSTSFMSKCFVACKSTFVQFSPAQSSIYSIHQTVNSFQNLAFRLQSQTLYVTLILARYSAKPSTSHASEVIVHPPDSNVSSYFCFHIASLFCFCSLVWNSFNPGLHSNQYTWFIQI